MFKMSLFNSLKARTAAKKLMSLISNAMWKMFAMQMNEWVSEVVSLYYFLPFAQMTNQWLKKVFRTCFMKEKQREGFS